MSGPAISTANAAPEVTHDTYRFICSSPGLAPATVPPVFRWVHHHLQRPVAKAPQGLQHEALAGGKLFKL
jgi:hypothetical protein